MQHIVKYQTVYADHAAYHGNETAAGETVDFSRKYRAASNCVFACSLMTQNNFEIYVY